ncbi:MAG: HYR domain-containing protein [Blastocatellia bacterium]|nr:HYR domain-containing protein [Blastocatellia bacterium]
MNKIHGLLLISVMVLIACAMAVGSAVSNGSKAAAPKTTSVESFDKGAIAVHAHGRGNPWINLSDGHSIETRYRASTELLRVFEPEQSKPLSIASADFDEGGSADLISAYAAPSGGVLTLHRGNPDSVYPNSPEAERRKAAGEFTDSPFLSEARVFEIPEAADFLGTGDFDADGHKDIVTASRGSNALYLLAGDGHGGFGAAQRIDLPGAVTALVTGDINRADGLTDVAVGVVTAEGPKALIFEGPGGAMSGSPESIDLPDRAADMVIGQLNDDFLSDLAVAAGKELVVIKGRDRRLSLDETRQSEVARAVVTRRRFPDRLLSLAIGDFSGDRRADIALLTEDGKVQLLSAGKNQYPNRKGGVSIEKWKKEVLVKGGQRQMTRLICARVSSLPADTIVALDPGSRQLHLITRATKKQTATDNEPQAADSQMVSLDVDGEPAAVLQMRLNKDALGDLVILRSGHSAPAAMMTVPAITFTVNNNNDMGAGSFRQAIFDANMNPGPDEINFNVAGGANIVPMSALPNIEEAVTIDGTTQPGFMGLPVVPLTGANAGTVPAGLSVIGGATVIRGLVINNFMGNGIQILANGGNRVELCFIGTDLAGIMAVPNTESGVDIRDSSGNTVGGICPPLITVISGNGTHGVSISGISAGMNSVVGNIIGLDAAGMFAVPNTQSGVFIDGSSGNIIGGTGSSTAINIGGPGSGGNIISGNGVRGVAITGTSASGNLVQANFIGTDPSGTNAIANTEGGVLLMNAFANTIGGTAPDAGNLISGNTFEGVRLEGSATTNNLVQGNFIGTDVNGTADIGNNFAGVTISGANINTIGGTAPGARNIISGNNESGIRIAPAGSGNVVQGNFIGTDVTGMLALGNSGNGVDVESPNNLIGGTAPGSRNLISGNGGNGVGIFGDGANNLVQGNTIGTDTNGIGNLGNTLSGVLIEGSVEGSPTNNTIGGTMPDEGNVIAFNNIGVTVVGMGTVGNSILSNLIFDNTNLGIDLGGDGVTPNDAGDGDAGPNNLQNFPVLLSATTNGVDTVVQGTLNSTASTTFRVEFFLNMACDPSGNGEGRMPIASTMVTTDGGNVNFNAMFQSAAQSGDFITATATDPNGNTSEFSNCVIVGALTCTITCPPNQTSGADPGQCGAVVNYPAPTIIGMCPPVACIPASGSFFPIGTTRVDCIVDNEPFCSFNVTVTDNIAPTISCFGNITTSAARDQQSAVVNYVPANVTDNCPIAPVAVCLPPSGSTFPLGVSVVTCTARDGAGNTATCTFTITVNDSQAPTITCPANVMASAPAGQNATIVNFPPPVVADNMPGITVACVPPSGSSFPVGVTNVTCTATDAAGNAAVCGFTVTVTGGSSAVEVRIEDGAPAIQFGDQAPVRPRRKPKPNKSNCELFQIANVGFAQVVLTLDGIRRTGNVVTSGRISDPEEGIRFALSIVNPNGSETPIDETTVITIGTGEEVDFCLRFLPVFPAVAGRTTGLAAIEVLPDSLTSRVDFRVNGGGTVGANITGQLAGRVNLIDPDNPRNAPVVTFTRSGDEFILTYSVYDPDLDVNLARYELLNGNGQVVQAFEVDLATPLSQANLLTGQSFTVEQRFGGANDHPEIAGIRVAVSDPATSATASVSLAQAGSAAIGLSLREGTSVKVLLRQVRLRRRFR